MKKSPYKIRLIISGAVLLLSALALCGFYPVKFLNLQFTPLFERLIFDFSAIVLILFSVIILLTVIYGRIYCSIICPLGILQEFIGFIKNKNQKISKKNYGFKYIISALSFGFLIGGSAIVIKYIDPYSIFSGALSFSIINLAVFLIIILLTFFKNRFFCTNICPIGAVLGLISKISFKKIYVDKNCIKCGTCEKFCPSGCIYSKEQSIDNETCIKCLKCLDICPNNAIKYDKQPIKFNPKRRVLLWGIGAFGLLVAGYATGVKFTKNIANKIKNIILPPGAHDADEMINKCLNCNLCVNNCPTGVLSKANDEIPFVHIDFIKGKHFCEYNCNICSKVCPSGAIKKIDLEKKQNIKIALAVVEKTCVGCGKCIKGCPKGAISIENQKALIDSSKCIGCGKCAAICKKRKAIHMIAIDN